jgi:hypothetical protein
VPVEELDHTRRLAGCAQPVFDALSVERIDDPEATEIDECVPAALQELVRDPAEREPELVARLEAHATVVIGPRPARADPR